MKLLIQWTTDVPTDWTEYDITSVQDIRSLPSKPEPTGGEIIDGTPGWVFALNVQGVTFTGFDHFSGDITGDGLAIIAWSDDAADVNFQGYLAHVWTFLLPKHDPFINAVNTDQRLDIYTDTNPERFANQSTSAGPVIVHPWADFTVPKPANLVRHGINVEDSLADAHEAARTARGWEEWAL